MRYTAPDYYKKFKCLAGECPATCCAGWQIVIDSKSLARYASMKGIFGNRVKNSINWKEHTFQQYGNRCAFLNEQNLCDLHIEAGTDMMCTTCRKYPHHIEVFDNEREISLSMSCPAAAKLILGRKTPVTFLTAENQKQDEEEATFDFFLYSVLQDTRALFFELLQKRNENVFLRMAKVLALAHDVQNRIDGRRIFEVEEVLTAYRKESVQKRLEEKLKREIADKAQADMPDGISLLNLLSAFEVLDCIWSPDIENWKSILRTAQRQEQGKKDIQQFFASSVIPDTEYEQMMVYYLYTYFCGAVYDGEALAKVKAAVASTLIWSWISCAVWLENGKKLSFQERLQLAWRYSRELEHSDLNLNKMDEMAIKKVQMKVPILLHEILCLYNWQST